MILASFLAGVIGTIVDPGPTYFATHTRAWEFLAGGLLALLDWRERAPERLRAALSWAGILAIVGSSALYDASTPFPGVAAAVPVVIGTTGFDADAVDAAAREAGIPCFHAPNFARGAVLMMRFAEEAAKAFPRAEIVELHDEAKADAPSGTAKATAARMRTEPTIHSVRLPGLVAHQEVIFGGAGETLTIRPNPLSSEVVKLKKADVARQRPARLSLMPEGLIDTLNEQEILDLIAYVRSGGNKDDKAFKR